MSDEQPPDEPEADNEVIRTLRQQVKDGNANKARAEALERELAFTKAGIDPDDPRQKYFVQGYSGDLSADAIRAEATAAGFLGAAEPEPQGMTEQERATFRNTQEAAAAGVQPQPEKDIYEPFRNANPRNGESPEQFGIRLAQAIESEGGFVSYDGPFRENPRDTGLVQIRSGTPEVRPHR